MKTKPTNSHLDELVKMQPENLESLDALSDNLGSMMDSLNIMMDSLSGMMNSLSNMMVLLTKQYERVGHCNEEIDRELLRQDKA